MRKLFFIILYIAVLSNSWAQNKNSVTLDDLIGRMMEQSESLFEHMDQMMDQLSDKFFDDDKFFSQFDNIQLMGGSRGQWIETDKEKILKLNVSLEEGMPVDIKIEDNLVKVSGTEIIENKTQNSLFKSMRSFSETYPIPRDVDPNKAQIEKAESGVIVKFPLLTAQRNPKSPPPKNVKPPAKKPRPKRDKLPIKAGETVI